MTSNNSVNYDPAPVALDLTDILLFYQLDETVFPEFLRQTGCRRLYIGSYFCEKYFIKACMELLRNTECFEGYSITLVVPVSSESMLRSVKDTLKHTLDSLGEIIDEVIVNDYGMLEMLSGSDSGYGIRIIAGRLFFRNYRDARYGWRKEISGPVIFPSELTGKVFAADLDLYSGEMDLSEIPDNVGVHIHYPYVYTTLSRLCEFASASVSDEMKFRTTLPCKNECMSGWITTDTENVRFLHFGKAVYAKGPSEAVYSREPERFVYWPAEEFVSSEMCEVYDEDLNAF